MLDRQGVLGIIIPLTSRCWRDNLSPRLARAICCGLKNLAEGPASRVLDPRPNDSFATALRLRVPHRLLLSHYGVSCKMRAAASSNRGIRTRVCALLESDDLCENLHILEQIQVRKTIRPLLAALAHVEQKIKMRAAMVLGIQVSRLAGQDMEAAREVVRRLIWSLNHESGSAGWGAPLAMAEIMLNHEGLATEYAHMLISYMQGGANPLEEIPLQRDLLQGLGRLGQVRREMLREKGACAHLNAYMESEAPVIRGLAAWCAGLLGAQEARHALQILRADTSEVTLYSENEWTTSRVSDLAGGAMSALGFGTRDKKSG